MDKRERFRQFIEDIFMDVDAAIKKTNKDHELAKICNENGETAFHYVVIENRIDLAEKLLSVGFDINAQDYAGATPLMRSVQLNYYEMTKWIVENDANLELKDEHENTALSYATSNDLYPIFELLIVLPRKKTIDYYYPDIEALNVFEDRKLVMRGTLIELGLSHRDV